MHFTALLALTTSALALPPKRSAQWGSSPWHNGHNGHPPEWGPQANTEAVAYFLDNDPAGSSIVSLHVAENGSLSQPLRTATGGQGAISVNSTGSPVPSDSLGSQGAVTVSDNLLFSVNAGSNTVSLFAIDPWNPFSPRLIGSPASTQGEFPISITFSAELRKACVLNGGATAGVTCYTVNPFTGLQIDGPLRQLNMSIIDETTPPSGPPGSAAQILFNPDSSALFATVKANSTSGEGFLLAWPVADGVVSTAEPVITQISGIALDFGFKFLSQSTIYLSDPSFGISLLEVGTGFTATEIVHTVIADQEAICWTEFDLALNTLYAIDAGADKIWKLNAQTGVFEGSIEVQLDGTNSSQGLFDSAIKDGFMYSLAATNGIVTVDLQKETQVSYLNLSSFGDRQYYQGFAVWP